MGDNGKNKPLKFGRNRKRGATVALKLVGDWHDKSRCFGKIGVLKYACCSVAQSWLTLCNPMDCSSPGFPVLHHLPELAQTHVHRVRDAIQPSHSLTPSSVSALKSFPASGPFLMSQIFASGGQSIGASASVLPMNIQGRFPLGWTGLS